MYLLWWQIHPESRFSMLIYICYIFMTHSEHLHFSLAFLSDLCPFYIYYYYYYYLVSRNSSLALEVLYFHLRKGKAGEGGRYWCCLWTPGIPLLDELLSLGALPVWCRCENSPLQPSAHAGLSSHNNISLLLGQGCAIYLCGSGPEYS